MKKQSSKASRVLRLAPVLVFSLFTLGSGMGNPGCGDGSMPCVDCEVEGSYQLTVDRPAGTLVCANVRFGETLELSRFGTRITSKVNETALEGELTGKDNTALTLEGENTQFVDYKVTFQGTFSAIAESTDQELTYSGTVSIEKSSPPFCRSDFPFRATRAAR